MNVASLYNLPQEILLMILQNIPQKFLYNCLLVNRCFSINSVRHIYLHAINEYFFNIPNILNERFIYNDTDLSIASRFAICLVKNFIKCLDDNDKKKLRDCDIYNIHELINEGSRPMFDYVSLVKKLDLMNLWNMIKFWLTRIEFIYEVENNNYKEFVRKDKIFLIFQLLCYLIDRRNPNVIYELNLSNFPSYEDPEFPCPNEIPNISHIFARINQISFSGDVFIEDIFLNNLSQICMNITDIRLNKIKESDFFDYEYLINLIHKQKNLTTLIGVDEEVLNEISEIYLLKLSRLFIEFTFEEVNLDGVSRCKNLQHLMIDAKFDQTDFKIWKNFFSNTQMNDLETFILLCNTSIIYEVPPFIRTTHNNLRVFHCFITKDYQLINHENIRILFETIATSCYNLLSFLFTIYSEEIINDLKIILISCKKLQELILHCEGFRTCGHLSILGKIIPSNLKILNINNMIYCKNDLHNLLKGCYENGIRNLVLDLTDTEFGGNYSSLLEILELFIGNGTLLKGNLP
ncbi:unnamed protein product [Rhizophagus irregularis]|nr:unnamed protein product [Rhizophagus irregularis]CAB4421913.1 unnamed protein product [Rhizophagus irregularis]